jgi:hypothetical protein
VDPTESSAVLELCVVEEVIEVLALESHEVGE